MPINDIYSAGIASGWKVLDAATFTASRTLEADVAIVGSGAGGGIAAEVLSDAGLTVLLLEEGGLHTSDSFKDMDEARAYRELYQEAAARATSDGAISILQGRAVGGSTTVNWSSSFRTPPQTLAHWAAEHAVIGHSEADMAPWFAQIEERLGMAPWAMDPNPNNAVLRRGCEKLGWEWHVIPRNVKGCWNSGYCGLGCPVNAKQSMLVSTISNALARGATLVHRLRVRTIDHDGKIVHGLTGEALGHDGYTATGIRVGVRARYVIVAGGAINTPALLLRSRVPDPHEQVGRRTFIHPVNLSIAEMPEKIDPYYGAPQSVASDHFQWRDGATGPMGYKLEVPPMFPGISAGVFNGMGKALQQQMAALPHTNAMLALLRDGFVPDSPGGRVRIADDGSPILDYEVSDYLWDGVRRAYLSMAEAQFAAGARRVRPAHLDGNDYTTWPQAREAIGQLPLKKFRVLLFSAHLMGGCAMSEDPARGAVNSAGRHHQLQNLYVFDGSAFPTSIGANPQLSVFALTAQNASAMRKTIMA
ncbi:GMC family oxidoreductase [Cupriavidus sp.]|uniref:GMC family oxidoreductase n=1 Tax=Cupriavidus sp. TaxID=1873897 RepID=UPI0025BCF92E|nr:GMC family oxidoreductase [Cupriavidus sp.]MCA3187638.1 GMC family oxidoreductase [Cupriavidus sp.]MCA3190046.1 GMC family oxidoreductase [Cupriavidus sp.]MCA3197497.1 GMC family oxidoreductase [Cupriavidus sp.]MCA3201836.1 GMC family oxidoreductase [Cupriavidus sp.]MCA3207857.1 GMC family oxidoreductase [Cupriavidus sp.]